MYASLIKVFKSFQTNFATYEIDNYVSSYMCEKLEKMGKQNFKISYINMTTLDPSVYMQTQNLVIHMCVFAAQNSWGDLYRTSGWTDSG